MWLGSNFLRIETIPEGSDRENSSLFQQIFIDDQYFDVLEIKMAKGRDFAADYKTDTTDAILINETAAKKAGWSDPIGKRIDLVQVDGSIDSRRVVGVVKDFHFANARQELEPAVFTLNTGNTFLFVVRLAGGNINQTVEKIGKVYEEVYPGRNYNYQFLDDVFDRQFQNDREFATNVAYFSTFAIFIACLGSYRTCSIRGRTEKRRNCCQESLGLK